MAAARTIALLAALLSMCDLGVRVDCARQRRAGGGGTRRAGRGSSSGSGPASRPTRAAAPGRASWIQAPEAEWSHKAPRSESELADALNVGKGRGRGRATKRAQRYDELRAYALFHARVLRSELEEEQRQARERVQRWTRAELARDGSTVFELSATARGRLYADTVVRLDLRGAPLPFHRFTAGDLVAVSPTGSSGPALPAAEARAAASGASDGGGAELDALDAREGGDGSIPAVVLSRSPKFIDVCVRASSAAEASSFASLTAGRGRWRLDQGVSSIPYERMGLALDTFTTPAAGGGEDAEDALRDCIVRCFDERGADAASAVSGGAPRGGAGSHADQRPGKGGVEHGAEGQIEVPPSAKSARPPRRALSEVCDLAALDGPQRAAVRASFERVLTLVQGPPGTGKTRTACAMALATARCAGGGAGGGGRCLLVAPSNVATDGLLAGCLALGLRCVRLGRPACVRPELRERTLDAIVPADGGGGGGAGGGQGSQSSAEAREALLRARWAALRDAEVIVATATGAGELLTGPLAAPELADAASAVRFALCLVDEAAQCIEPAALVAMVAARHAARTVLVGDQCQLGPVLLAGRAQLGAVPDSLFARLAHAGVGVQLLSTQYRCTAALADFSSRRFYAGRLRSVATAEDRPRPPMAPLDAAGAVRWPENGSPLLYVDTRGARADGGYHERRQAADVGGTAEASAEWLDGAADGAAGARAPPAAEDAGAQPARAAAGGTSLYNPCEAAVVVAAVRALLEGGISAQEIGVITPYAAMVSCLNDALGGAKGGSAAAVEVNTVDGFQGREKEAIIVAAVRSNEQGVTGFLKDWRRLNVSLTRARRALIVVGDSRTLERDPHWRAFVMHARRTGSYTELRGED